jgi:hypothetical protein
MTQRRWIYALGGLVVVLAVALAVALLTRDDGDDQASGDATTTTTIVPSSSAAASTTSPATTAAPATTASLPPLGNDTESYAKYVFASWQQNNRQAAAQAASADAVNQMFAQAYSPQQPYTFGACNPAAGSVYCTWNGTNGATITMTVRNLTGGLPIQVVGVQRS